MLMELARFLPYGQDRRTVSPERAAQDVREIRRITEGGLRFRYSVVQELAVRKELVGENGKVDVLVFTHQLRDGGWGSTAVLHEPERKSTEHPTILGSVTLDALSLEDAIRVTDEWIANSTTGIPLELGDKTVDKIFPLLEDRYEEHIYHVSPNTPHQIA